MANSVPLPPPGFDDLSVDEKIDYLQSLWDRIAASPGTVPVPDWHLEIIDERLRDPSGSLFRPLAEADLENAAQWYDEERPGLAERFLTDLDRSFVRLRERPLQFPVVAGDVRRALLHTFPYASIFESLTR